MFDNINFLKFIDWLKANSNVFKDFGLVDSGVRVNVGGFYVTMGFRDIILTKEADYLKMILQRVWQDALEQGKRTGEDRILSNLEEIIEISRSKRIIT